MINYPKQQFNRSNLNVKPTVRIVPGTLSLEKGRKANPPTFIQNAPPKDMYGYQVIFQHQGQIVQRNPKIAQVNNMMQNQVHPFYQQMGQSTQNMQNINHYQKVNPQFPQQSIPQNFFLDINTVFTPNSSNKEQQLVQK